MLASIVALALLAQAPPAGDSAPAKSDTMKSLVKDALAETDAGPDLSKLPFTPDSIRQVVLSHQPKIQSCYEEAMAGKGSKKLEGVLKTKWTITADGLVKGAVVKKKQSTLKDARLHECVVAVLSTMAFPKPPGGKPQPIEFPFNLKAVH
jgi:hypothetical protein